MDISKKLEAIREAVGFIQHNWVGSAGVWRGEASDFVGASEGAVITKSDVKNIVKAINCGEPIPLEDIGGTIFKNEIIEVWVSKCMG